MSFFGSPELLMVPAPWAISLALRKSTQLVATAGVSRSSPVYVFSSLW